jgi:N-acetylglucosaminyldiphosphoundecaprenol N-acetyl-beta-D-mannosaminyltransferase
LEKREYSCYLIGGKNRILQKTERNIRQTFPKLRIVGRFPGYFRRQDEATIIQAIKKASPSLLMVGKGIRGKERWIPRNNVALGKGLRLWCSDIFDVFAEKKKHPSRASFDKGLEWIGYCFQKPYKIFRIFPYIFYKLLLLKVKLFNKNK